MIEIVTGDIEKQTGVDVIVNAANHELRHGSGVCHSIFEAAGAEQLEAECKKIIGQEGEVTPGHFAITDAHNLAQNGVKFIFHAVGPIYSKYTPERAAELLRLVHLRLFAAMRCTAKPKLQGIALPAISTGVFGYPVEEAARIAIKAASEYPELYIRFVLWPDKVPVYTRALAELGQ
jgi:O-acetyl-ADP-ribose deacetylase (regulator of RNase III)